VGSALRLVLGAVAAVAVVGTAAAAFGVRGPAFAWIAHFMMMAWTSAVLQVVQPLLRSRWFQVRDREPLVYRRLGVRSRPSRAAWFMKTGCCATGSPDDLRRQRSQREPLFIDRVKRFTRKRGGSRARRVR
jgi:hypothetical protein